MKHNLKAKPEILIKKFKALSNREDVANLLEIPDKTLRYYLYYLKDSDKYHTFTISKKKWTK